MRPTLVFCALLLSGFAESLLGLFLYNSALYSAVQFFGISLAVAYGKYISDKMSTDYGNQVVILLSHCLLETIEAGVLMFISDFHIDACIAYSFLLTFQIFLYFMEYLKPTTNESIVSIKVNNFLGKLILTCFAGFDTFASAGIVLLMQAFSAEVSLWRTQVVQILTLFLIAFSGQVNEDNGFDKIVCITYVIIFSEFWACVGLLELMSLLPISPVQSVLDYLAIYQCALVAPLMMSYLFHEIKNRLLGTPKIILPSPCFIASYLLSWGLPSFITFIYFTVTTLLQDRLPSYSISNNATWVVGSNYTNTSNLRCC